MDANENQWLGGAVLIGISLIAYEGLARMHWMYGTLRDGRIPETIAWYLLAFAAYLGALIWAEKRDLSMRWMWLAAILFRFVLLFTTPTLSDDVYRYLWDGYVANEGVSPYAHAIDSVELDYLDIPLRAQANNAWMASPYLPAAQLVFWGMTAVLPLRPLYLQILMVGFDLLSAWLLSRLLAFVQLPPRRLLLYLWNPLVIIEVAHGAHIDAWMVLLTLLAVYFAIKSPAFLSPIFLSLAALTKILPVLLLPILFWRWNWRQRTLFGLMTIAILLPFGYRAGWGLTGDLTGTGLFSALRIYGDQWNFNSGFFHWLEGFLGQRGVPEPVYWGKFIFGGIFLMILTAVWKAARHSKEPGDWLRLSAVPFIAYTLLTPTLHPWYIIILLSFLPFLSPHATESKWRWLLIIPWLYLSGTLIYSYLTYLDPLNFGELEWVRRLEWLPTLILLGTAVLFHIYSRYVNSRVSSPQ